MYRSTRRSVSRGACVLRSVANALRGLWQAPSSRAEAVLVQSWWEEIHYPQPRLLYHHR